VYNYSEIGVLKKIITRLFSYANNFFRAADIADAKQITAIKKTIEGHNLPNNKGVFVCISNRSNWTQSWCPDCLCSDVIYDEESKELECEDCGFTATLKETYGMKKLVQHTVHLLPELAKDAFMFSQTASISEKDRRAKNIVKDTAKDISLDASGAFIQRVAEMCAKLFVIWGWPLTADTFRDGLAQMQAEYVQTLKFRERFAAAALDKLLGSKLSKAFTGLIGMTMNRGMKKLNEQLLKHVEKGDLNKVQIQDFIDEADLSDDLIRTFFECALIEGVDLALDKFWDMTVEELAQYAQVLAQNGGNDGAMNQLFGGLQLTEDQLKQIQSADEGNADVQIGEVSADDESKGLLQKKDSAKKEDDVD